MQKQITLNLLPSEATNEHIIKECIAAKVAVNTHQVTGFYFLKKSIDARGKQPRVNLTLQAYINEPFTQRKLTAFDFKDVTHASKKVIVVGAGPAGLFAALRLIESGIKPILLERGKNVRSRRRDLAILNKEGIVNPESNYCFGEGGAGTYSDGKLYTRSNKRGDIDRILHLFVRFGADEKILYESHPHIGTNKLPGIITSIREHLIHCGAEVLFEKKVTEFIIDNDHLKGVRTSDGDLFEAAAVILATGHSARDIFQLLRDKHILIEAKPFALGVRIEHPQSIIDTIQYHCSVRDTNLPPASYSLVQQVNQKGVFSFCMCPGGIIAPAATSPGELVVNGWSPSKRDNPFANSGMVVSVELGDAIEFLNRPKTQNPKFKMDDPLVLMKFQQAVEQRAFEAGGGKFTAPAQRMADFIQNKVSSSLPGCSYLPGINSVNLGEVLPSFIYNRLKEAFVGFGKKMRGYLTNEAVILATESRTSSPVRIPRDAITLMHPQIKNLYPCAEGAGYAGGIVSAAMDGEKVANRITAGS
jgi:uncharacterized FAD-dependent dehydrogenase